MIFIFECQLISGLMLMSDSVKSCPSSCSLFGERLVCFLPVVGGSSTEKAEAGADEPLNRAPAIESFYTSWLWRKCRKAFAESKGNLCERCLRRGIIEPGSKERPLEVHHKVQLTASNVKDPRISLNWENLELLCKACHEEERERKPKRWKIRPDGTVDVPPGR